MTKTTWASRNAMNADIRRMNAFLNPPTTGSYVVDQKIRAERAQQWANFVKNAK